MRPIGKQVVGKAVQSAETGSGRGRYISGDVCAGSHY